MTNQIKGRIFAYHNPDTKTLEVITDNRGASPGLLTHNIFPTKQAAETSTVHDDMQYGHGNPIPNGTDARPGTVVQRFPMGGRYNGHVIKPGMWHRVGVRYQAWAVFQIPQPGEVVEIPYEKMKNGNRYNYNYGNQGAWNPVKFKDDLDVGGDASLMRVFEVLNNGPIRTVKGKVEIIPVAHENDPKRLRGWDVWFHNQAEAEASRGRTTGFIGTLVLTNDGGEGTKNAGIGLESMVCPDKGYSVRQFIKANGDYGVKQHGVRAVPGTKVRLGIRGHATADTQLPSLEDGPVSLSLAKFKKLDVDASSDWFTTDTLMPKMGEKKGLVDLYRNKERINDEIPDTVYKGREAFDRAEFKEPPRVRVAWVDPNDVLPAGGWEVRVTSKLPAEDDIGPVGFTGRIQVLEKKRAYEDVAVAPPRTFTDGEREKIWYLRADEPLAGFELEPGRSIRFDTGALGWRSKIALPGPGAEAVDTDDDVAKRWELCESNTKRAFLTPAEELSGAAADKAGALPAPSMKVAAVGHSDDTPGGGWIVSVESRLPEKAGRRKVGMIATPVLGYAGRDRAQLPPTKLTAPGQTATWFIPRGSQIGGYFAKPGETLTIDTGALGWKATIDLPKKGEVQVAGDGDGWTWHEERSVPDDVALKTIEALNARSAA